MLGNIDPISQTQHWIKSFVIELGLCPFAYSVIEKDEVLYKEDTSRSSLTHLTEFMEIISTIETKSNFSTGFLIFSRDLEDFESFLDLFDKCNWALSEYNLEEKYQLAGFHPEYVFEEAENDDPANYTNRSPYPMIHVLDTPEVGKLIDSYPDINGIPLKNIEKLRKLGTSSILRMIKTD